MIKDEWEDMTDYAKRYLDLVQDDYRTIWWKIFNSPSDNNWNNILPLIELIFAFLCLMVDWSACFLSLTEVVLVKTG